jgi:DNA replication protein DnaC
MSQPLQFARALHEVTGALEAKRGTHPGPPDTRDEDWPSAPREEHYTIETRGGLLVATPRLPCCRCADGLVAAPGPGGYTWTAPCRCHRWHVGAQRFTRARLPEGCASHTQRALDGSRIQNWGVVAPALRAAVQGTRGALLTGSTGTGKSHAAAAVLRCATLEHATPARWARWPDVLGACRAAIQAHGDPEGILDDLTRGRLLVLDELGGERTTDWTSEALTRVMSAAIDRGCVVLATSNYTAPDLGRIIGERSSSRLAQLCPEVVVRAADYRRQQAPGR